MRSNLVVILCISLIVLSACRDQTPPPRPEVARPAKLITVEGPGLGMLRSFPGEVRASDVADMAFRVSGRIIELPATRGMQVKEGDLLARLDPADYQAVVNQMQAQYDLAVAQFDRAAELVGLLGGAGLPRHLHHHPQAQSGHRRCHPEDHHQPQPGGDEDATHHGPRHRVGHHR